MFLRIFIIIGLLSVSCDETFQKVSQEESFAGLSKIIDREDGTYSLLWSKVPADGTISYAIYMRGADGSYDFKKPLATTLDSSYQTENLSFTKNPCFKVRMIVSGVEDENNVERCAQSAENLFAGIEDAIYQENGSYLLSWNGGNSESVGYHVFIRQGSKPFTWNRPALRTLGSDIVTKTNYKLGEKVCFSVRAVNPSTGKRLEENTKEICRNGLDEGVTLFPGIESAKILTGSSVEVKWGDVDPSFKVGGFSIYSDSLFTKKVAHVEPSLRSSILVDLEAGATYSFGVRFINDKGLEDNNTKTISITIPDLKAIKFDGISDAVLDSKTGQITVTWSPPESLVEQYAVYLGSIQRSGVVDGLVCEDVTYYEACRSYISYSNPVTTVDGGQKSAVVELGTPLPDDFAYFVAVRATGENKIEESNGITKKVTTVNNGHPLFEGVLNASKFDNDIKLSWKKPIGEVSQFRITVKNADGDIFVSKSSLIGGEGIPYTTLEAIAGNSIVTEFVLTSSSVVIDNNNNNAFDSGIDTVGFSSGNTYFVKVNAVDRYGSYDDNQSEAVVSFLDTIAPTAQVEILPGYKLEITPSDNVTPTAQIKAKVFKKEAATGTDFPVASDTPIMESQGVLSITGNCDDSSAGYHNYLVLLEDMSGNASTAIKSVKCDTSPPIGYVKISKEMSGLSYDYYLMESQAQNAVVTNETTTCFTANERACIDHLHERGGTSKLSAALCGCNPKTHSDLQEHVASVSLTTTPAKTTIETAQAACVNASSDHYIVRAPSFHEMKMATRWHGQTLVAYKAALNGCQLAKADASFIANDYLSCTTPHGVKMFTGGRKEYLMGSDLSTFSQLKSTLQEDAIHHMKFDLDEIGYYHWHPSGTELLWDLSSRYRIEDQTDGLATRGFRCVAFLRAKSPGPDKRALAYSPDQSRFSVEKEAAKTVLSWKPRMKKRCANVQCGGFNDDYSMTYKIYRFNVGKPALETYGIQPLWIEKPGHAMGGYPIDGMAIDGDGNPLYTDSSEDGKLIATITDCSGEDSLCTYEDKVTNNDGYVAGRSYFYSLVTVDQDGNSVQDIWSGNLFQWSHLGQLGANEVNSTLTTAADGVEKEGDSPDLYGGFYLSAVTDDNGHLYITPEGERQNSQGEYKSNEIWRWNPKNYRFTRLRGLNDVNTSNHLYNNSGGWDPSNTPGGRHPRGQNRMVVTKAGQLALFGPYYKWQAGDTTLDATTPNSELWFFDANIQSPNYTYWKLGKASTISGDVNCVDSPEAQYGNFGWETGDGRLVFISAYNSQCFRSDFSVISGGNTLFTTMWQYTPTNVLDYSLGGSWQNLFYGHYSGGTRLYFWNGSSHDEVPDTHAFSHTAASARFFFGDDRWGPSEPAPTMDGMQLYSYTGYRTGAIQLWNYDLASNRWTVVFEAAEDLNKATFRSFHADNRPIRIGVLNPSSRHRSFHVYPDKYNRVWIAGATTSSEVWVYDLELGKWMHFSGEGACVEYYDIQSEHCPEVPMKLNKGDPSPGAWPPLSRVGMEYSIDHKRGKIWFIGRGHIRDNVTGNITFQGKGFYNFRVSMEEDGYH